MNAMRNVVFPVVAAVGLAFIGFGCSRTPFVSDPGPSADQHQAHSDATHEHSTQQTSHAKPAAVDHSQHTADQHKAMQHEAAPAKAAMKPSAAPYPLTTCVVSSEDLDSMGGPVVYQHQGREVRFCCKGCIKKFEAEPAKYLTKLDAPPKGGHGQHQTEKPAHEHGQHQAAPAGTPEHGSAATAKPSAAAYPLSTCVVSGQDLGSMGGPVVHKHHGREVRFCCKGCVPKFNADPAKYLTKLDAAPKAGHGEHQHHKSAPDKPAHGGHSAAPAKASSAAHAMARCPVSDAVVASVLGSGHRQGVREVGSSCCGN